MQSIFYCLFFLSPSIPLLCEYCNTEQRKITKRIVEYIENSSFYNDNTLAQNTFARF